MRNNQPISYERDTQLDNEQPTIGKAVTVNVPITLVILAGLYQRIDSGPLDSSLSNSFSLFVFSISQFIVDF